MELNYASVTQFYVDLKAHLLGAGMSVVRTVVPDTDLILDTGSGFFRFRRVVVSPSVTAVGWEFGADADVLAVAAWDAERQMPFATTPGAEFVPTFAWEAEAKRMFFTIAGGGEGTHGSRYRISIDLTNKVSSVQHEDRFRPQYEPNFKDKGGAYIPAGI